jgi:hypothetical protein
VAIPERSGALRHLQHLKIVMAGLVPAISIQGSYFLTGSPIFSAGAGGNAGLAPFFCASGSGRAGSGGGVVGRVPPGFDSAGFEGSSVDGGVEGWACAV